MNKQNRKELLLEKLVLVSFILVMPQLMATKLPSQGFSHTFPYDRQTKKAFLLSLPEEYHKQVVKLKSRYLLPTKQKKLRFRQEKIYIFLKFDKLPTKNQKLQLEKYGIKLHNYITDYTYYAKISQKHLSTLQKIPCIQGWESIEYFDKMPRYLFQGKIGTWARNADDTALLNIYFHRDVPFQTASDIIYRNDGLIISHQRYSTSNKLKIKILSRLIKLLAEEEEVKWIEPIPPPRKLNNATAAALSHIDEVHVPPYNLTGAGVKAGQWDGGEVDENHPDFDSRVIIVESTGVNTHATQVAGTIGGSGAGDPNAKGMAPGVIIYSYTITGDDTATTINEQQTAQTTYGISATNNSWVYVIGWNVNEFTDNQELFGDYNVISADWDGMIKQTDLLMIKGAGNERDDDDPDPGNPPDGPHDGTLYNGEYYDCIDFAGCAKNVIAVGAISDTKTMTSFSSWGPADDGRVKPDFVANGASVYSTTPGGSYGYNAGTSFSCPVTTGGSALLIEAYRNASDSITPSAEIVRGLLAETAEDLGNAGPDYAYGFGLINIKEAVDLILNHFGNENEQYIATGELIDRQKREYTTVITPGQPVLKVTLNWLDEPGNPLAEKAIVNNLDLILIEPDGTTIHYPFMLNKDTPDVPATTNGPNDIDTIEQIIIDNPISGNWTIRVTGTLITTPTQTFALISNIGFNAINPHILIFDHDDGDTPFDGINDDFSPDDGEEVPFETALTNLGYRFETLAELPPDLSPYQVIFMVLGHRSRFGFGGYTLLTTEEQNKLIDFINGGGDVYIEGPDFGTRYSGEPLYGYFFCNYDNDGKRYNQGNIQYVEGLIGTITENMVFSYDYQSLADHYVDIISPQAGASLIWQDQDVQGRGVIYDSGSSSQRIHTTFMLGGLSNTINPNRREEYLAGVLDFFRLYPDNISSVNLSSGWTLFGTNTFEPILWDNCQLTDGGNTLTTYQAEQKGWIQGLNYYFDPQTKDYQIVPADDNYLQNYYGYWTWTNNSGLSLLLPSKGVMPYSNTINLGSSGWTLFSIFYEKVPWDSLEVDKDSVTKTVSEAEDAGWLQGDFYYYDSVPQLFNLCPRDDLYLHYYLGYWSWAGEDNLDLIINKP